jgi:hypothetical protein
MSQQQSLEFEAVFPYYSGRGRCYVLRYNGVYDVYFQDEGKKACWMERHRDLVNAESVARWMAVGL